MCMCPCMRCVSANLHLVLHEWHSGIHNDNVIFLHRLFHAQFDSSELLGQTGSLHEEQLGMNYDWTMNPDITWLYCWSDLVPKPWSVWGNDQYPETDLRQGHGGSWGGGEGTRNRCRQSPMEFTLLPSLLP